MAGEIVHWRSFGDLIRPAEAAQVLAEWYGAGAANAARKCAAAALANGRDADHRFWLAVATDITGAS